jgi:signal transduction histidine kinase
MWKVAIKYAVLASIFEALLFHVSRSFDTHPLTDLSHLFFDIIILAIFIFLGVYEYKRYANQGVLHFWEGMSVGFLVYTPSIVLFGFFLYFYFDQALLEEYQEIAMKIMIDQKAMYVAQFGEAQFDQQYEEIKNISENRLILSALVKKLIAGFFVTPALSIVLRKKPKK